MEAEEAGLASGPLPRGRRCRYRGGSRPSWAAGRPRPEKQNMCRLLLVHVIEVYVCNAHDIGIVHGWRYLLYPRFSACFVLKLASQRGEGETRGTDYGLQTWEKGIQPLIWRH